MGRKLDEYVDRFGRLRVNANPRSTPSLHKPCLLLAVIDLAERGDLPTNRVRYPAVKAAFERYYRAVESSERSAHGWYPFFHLRSDRFWTLHPRPGRQAELQRMKRPDTERKLEDNVDHAALAPDLHALFLDPAARTRLRAALIDRWFPDRRAQVERVIEAARRATPIAQQGDAIAPAFPDRLSATARDDPFRQRVIEAYDYRCAATGLRVVVPGSGLPVAPLIEAVRLMPRSASPRGDVRYGIALSPTWGCALHSGLIAPGPDMKWHVSRVLDARIPDNAPVLELAGRNVIFTGDRRNLPVRRALAWSLERLRTD